MDLIKIFPLPPTPTSQMFLPILISSGTCNCWLFSVGLGHLYIYIKYVLYYFRGCVNYWWVSILRQSNLHVSFFFGEISSAMRFWKMQDDNNCNFAARLDPVLCRSCLPFSATPAMLRSLFLCSPGCPADVQTSGDFLCCQIIRCLLYTTPAGLLSLR